MGLGPGMGCCSAGTDPSLGRARPVRDKEDPTDWLITDGGKKQVRQRLYSGWMAFLNPNPQIVVCTYPLGQKEILSWGKHRLYFFGRSKGNRRKTDRVVDIGGPPRLGGGLLGRLGIFIWVRSWKSWKRQMACDAQLFRRERFLASIWGTSAALARKQTLHLRFR